MLEIVGATMAYGSLIILLGGTGFLLLKKPGKNQTLFLAYIIALILLELLSKMTYIYGSKSNLILLPISALVHLFFIVQIYSTRIFEIKRKKVNRILFFLMLPLCCLICLNLTNPIEQFQSPDQLFSSFVIILFCLFYLKYSIQGNQISMNYHFMNAMALCFFSLNLLLFAASNYLVNEKLDFVSRFWTFRAIILQLFYISLIHTTWKIGKTPLPH